MDLKLNIGTYCGLLWSLFGDHCNYYKELLKIYHILDREECFTIRNAYTKGVCARIRWAIIDERHSFFGQNPVASDFAPGSTFNFSTSYLKEITDAVLSAIPIQQAMFPWEWLTHTTPTVPYGLPPPGTPPTQWAVPAPAPQQAVPTVAATPPQVREDIRHPKIKLLIDPYLKKFNNFVNLSDILTSSGKRMTDLPKIPKYCHPTGQPFLFWNSVLGKCFWGS